MRNLTRLSFLAGAALAVSACGGGAAPANNAANEITDNGSLDTVGNDPSAMESIGNDLPPPPAIDNGVVDNMPLPDTAPPPSTPNVESNVAGM